ncbi:MAG: hypothetical protein LBR79_01140 [Oscillospiraceae bacterium]|nr:hypothetical protein [Oscillospiraceae bacterium]
MGERYYSKNHLEKWYYSHSPPPKAGGKHQNAAVLKGFYYKARHYLYGSLPRQKAGGKNQKRRCFKKVLL